MYSNYIVCFSWIIAIGVLAYPEMSPVDRLTTIEESFVNISDQPSSSMPTYYNYFSKEFIECPKIHLLPGEYVLLDNASLYIPAYDNYCNTSILDWRNYYIETLNESYAIAYICIPVFTISSEAERERKEKTPLSYITFACLSISLLSLALHFIAFLIVPKMRNLPGKNLASLTFSLFLGYLLYLVGIIFDNTPACRFLGICIYYFMMVSFFWMNVISYDILKAVRYATTKLRMSSKSTEFKRFLYYSLYSWLLPALLLAVVIVAEETTFFPYSLKPFFKKNRCWFRQRLAIIVFAASPVGILMFANVIFFVTSVIIISSNTMKSDKHKSNLKRSIFLYLKLLVISGLLWITGLVAEYVDKNILTYISLALYSLQGLYIFVAFTRFRKIAEIFGKNDKKTESTFHTPSLLNSTTSRLIHSKGSVVR